jgi:UDP-N-acetyl-D-galactosamine dehydrogenase
MSANALNIPNSFDHKIAVIGLGYVGLPLAVEFGKKYDVVGFDINAERIHALRMGEDGTMQTEPAEITAAKKLQFSTDLNDIRDCSIFIVTVPTPVDENKQPNLQPLLTASKMVGNVLKKGDIVIYESTVYPGCTEEDCVPVLQSESGLQYNQDFFCGYSPERINPGDKINTLTKIKKVTAGSTPEVANYIDALYASIITAGTHKASSIKVAEAAKSIENAQRDINISFVNELALIFDKMNIDTHEVLEAAATKWNFLPFKPGLVGGHCIGVDPYYLAYKAKQLGHTPQVILSGRAVNDEMSLFVANKLNRLMSEKGLAQKGAKVLLLGVTFKENCPDIRNSKVFEIVNHLSTQGYKVDAFDPFADAASVLANHQIQLVHQLEKYDGIILAVAHDFFKSLNYESLMASDRTVIYDTKSILDKKIVTARL